MNEETISLWVGRVIELSLTLVFAGLSINCGITYFLNRTKNFWLVMEYFLHRKKFNEWRKSR